MKLIRGVLSQGSGGPAGVLSAEWTDLSTSTLEDQIYEVVDSEWTDLSTATLEDQLP